MAEPKLYTEREKVLAERKAAGRARCSALWVIHGDTPTSRHRPYEAGSACEDCTRFANVRHELPRVTRPRVVTDRPLPDRQARNFRVVGGQIQTSSDDGIWHCLDNGSVHATEDSEGLCLRPERIRMLADLLANPTEECDDDR